MTLSKFALRELLKSNLSFDEVFEIYMLEYPRPVLTKKDFVRRYALGEFGNGAPTWNTYQEFSRDFENYPVDQMFHIRNRVAGGLTWYNVPKLELWIRWNTACALVDAENLYISAMCPTGEGKTLIQGEVMQSPEGLYLHYSQVDRPMREALQQESHHAFGLKAKLLLEKYLDWNSMDWMNGLLERYPHHVIEFTALSVKWGTVPGYNTVFWEVRNY